MRKWTGKYWITDEISNKISCGLKKYYKKNSPWNKGKKYGKYSETSSERFRKDKKYYNSELEKNAKRSLEKRYNDSQYRREEIKRIFKEKQKISGAGRNKRGWSEEEIKYLKDNFNKKDYLEIAIHLERSISSISHKVSRLKLRKYNKWN